MKTLIRRTALTSIAILFLLGGTTAAFANTPSQALNATLSGGVTNLGTQLYSMSGGQVYYGYLGTTPIDNGATIQYNLVAYQSGVSTSGYASIHFSGSVGGTPVTVRGNFQIGGADMGAGLPAGCMTPAEPTTPCTQILPFDFIGTSNVQLTVGTTTQSETMVIESPYWNPFGGPIYLASIDGAITIVATYSQGTILWTGAQVGGYISGTLGSSPFSGTFSQTSTEYENLVTGTATDAGTFQYSTNIASLNSPGTWTGSDTIPTTGIDCTSITMLPMTCTETGFISTGHFRAGAMSGTYSTTWGIPAYQFTSTATGAVSQTAYSGSSGNFFQNFIKNFLHF